MKTVQDYLGYPVTGWREMMRESAISAKRCAEEKSVCKDCKSHVDTVLYNETVVYACGSSYSKRRDHWSFIDTDCQRFRMRTRIKQLEKEVKRLRKKKAQKQASWSTINKRRKLANQGYVCASKELFASATKADIKTLLKDLKETPPEIQKLIDDNFWDLR